MTTPLTLSPAADPIQRAKGIGGSDIAVILGLSPYKTPLDLYCEKVGIWRDELASEAARWGQIMEPVLAAQYVQQFGRTIIRRDAKTGAVMMYQPDPTSDHPDINHYEGPHADLLGTLVHPEYEWARGHVDAIGLTVGTPRLIGEFKQADLRLAHLWGEPDTDQVPDPYNLQTQWYMMLADLEVTEIAALIGGNRFGRYVIRRDEILIDLMLERAAEFWQRVVDRNPPPPVEGERGAVSLSRLYPSGDRGKELEATPDVLEMALNLHWLRETAKKIEEKKTNAENDLKRLMADAARINLGPKSYISWNNNKPSTSIDFEAAFRAVVEKLATSPIARVVADEILEEHTTTKPGPRVFRCQGLDKLTAAS